MRRQWQGSGRSTKGGVSQFVVSVLGVEVATALQHKLAAGPTPFISAVKVTLWFLAGLRFTTATACLPPANGACHAILKVSRRPRIQAEVYTHCCEVMPLSCSLLWPTSPCPGVSWKLTQSAASSTIDHSAKKPGEEVISCSPPALRRRVDTLGREVYPYIAVPGPICVTFKNKVPSLAAGTRVLALVVHERGLLATCSLPAPTCSRPTLATCTMVMCNDKLGMTKVIEEHGGIVLEGSTIRVSSTSSRPCCDSRT